MKGIVLTHKVRIMHPVEIDWETLGEILNNLSYYGRKIMNETVKAYWDYQQENMSFKNLSGNYIDVKEIFGVKRYDSVIYQSLKAKYKEIGFPSDTLSGLVQNAIAKYDALKSDIAKGDAVLPSFRKKDIVIPVKKSQITLNDDFTAYLTLLDAKKADEYGFKGRRKQSVLVKLGTRDHEKIVLQRILDGTYELCDSGIQKQGKHWYVLLAYRQPVKERSELSDDVIVGVDLGIVNAAAIAVSNHPKPYYIHGGEIEAFRRRVEARRKSLQRQLKYCSHNRRGHGRKTLLKPLDSISHKIENFKRLTNHRYAKYIVDIALKHGAGVIQMEDLTGISKRKSFLRNWSYYDLQQKIEDKAKEYGIKVRKVSPKYTSQRCSKCGHIAKENRPGQSYFKCTDPTCGFELNADFNAARNLATPGIEALIKEKIGE